ncbi:MAG: hypothetical protein JNM79_06255 [Burkholderiales bacterium]|nr:hypothetical protein [Burkholderiales bacterium]
MGFSFGVELLLIAPSTGRQATRMFRQSAVRRTAIPGWRDALRVSCVKRETRLRD